MGRPTQWTKSIVMGLVILCISIDSQAEGGFSLERDDVVVFLGGANMVHLQQAGHLEALLTRAFASSRPSFRDLSWEGDTVFRQGTSIERWRKNGFGTRDEQLKRVGATVVIAQFGRLESLAGPNRLEEFTKTYGQLVDEFQRQAKLVVLITPTPFERPPSPLIPDLSRRNAELALYVKEIAQFSSKPHVILVDLFTNAKHGLTENGMHIMPNAQAHIAEEIARQLGLPISAQTDLEPLRQAVVEKHRLWYDYWRPANWKLLYGDDSQRQFTRGGKDYLPFRKEWEKLIPLIAEAEERVFQVADGREDPGTNRPAPEELHGDANANIQKELDSFATSDGLQVNLFASEREGLTSPLSIRWDPAGRMYVTVTTTYPHVFPGDVPNDKIIVLEDTNGDGKADKTTPFAEDLNIPTGLEWGDGGVYVGQNTELLFLQDTDGDGRADRRRVVLGGFGNGDSHQTINSFAWSPGGELYFGQGDGIESRVETPWGGSHLFKAGFFRFRPRRLQLHPLLDDFMGPGNPWGVAFDEWGQIFSVDGAGGVTFLSPGQIPTTHRLRLPTIGKPGGYCGIGFLDGQHLPESMRGDFVVGDFKSNRVQRFSVEEEGAGFTLQWKEPVLQSRHRNFRPVDVKVGPDGAIYVVDWYNPITCHQDDAYRDPTRDKAHGRIWRISGGAPPIKPPNLSRAAISKLLDALKSPQHWTRYQAKRALTGRDAAEVAKALDVWVRSLDPKLPRYEHHLYEALGAYATIEVVEPELLDRLLQAQDPKARAYATRIVGRWHDRLDRPLDLLAQRVADEHPRVRMEAVIACAAIPSVRSIEVAAHVVDEPTDAWIDYAFKQAVHHLKPHWMVALKSGQLSFARPSHLAAVLNESGGRGVLERLKGLVESEDLDPESRNAAIGAILAVGGANEWQEFGLDRTHYTRSGSYDAACHAEALARMVEVARFRDVRPAGDLAAALNQLMDQEHAQLQAAALALAGIWNVDKTKGKVLAAVKNDSLPVSVRAAAFAAIVEMNLPESAELLVENAQSPYPQDVRSAAIQSLVSLDAAAAARHAVELFGESDLMTQDLSATLVAFLNRAGGAQALASALTVGKLKPESAKALLRSLFSTGRSDDALFGALDQAIGASAQVPDHSEDLVNRLVSDASKEGEAERGAALFKSLACSSCHQVGGIGGVIGPDLTAIGTTLSGERIVEELLWPNRQVKEGYSVVQVITDRGKIHQGFERTSKEGQASGDLIIQELVTQKLVAIERKSIEEMRSRGSPMPAGLTAILSRPQLLDLIRHLSELGKIKTSLPQER